MIVRNRMFQACGLSLALLAAAGCTPNAAPSEEPRTEVAAQPVFMGIDETEDACGGQGRVKEGRTVVVRSAPDAAAAEIDRLEGGTVVFLCDGDDAKPDWLGVAYESKDRTDCSAVASTAPPRTPIPATCASGWVMQSDDLEMVAG